MRLVAQGVETRNISGRVVDENRESILFANVLAHPYTIGTLTNIMGNFSLRIPTNGDTLIIYYTGFSTKIFTPLADMDSILVVLVGGEPMSPAIVSNYNSSVGNEDDTFFRPLKTADQLNFLPEREIKSIEPSTPIPIAKKVSPISHRCTAPGYNVGFPIVTKKTGSPKSKILNQKLT
ncbi:MAG: carboxypeptidase-like regulatory domain-containing protein [Bacteroidota bacterium]|nr:carboxypeptidase-like regulatory domain-containing protein [Bacteroidota bacterium]